MPFYLVFLTIAQYLNQLMILPTASLKTLLKGIKVSFPLSVGHKEALFKFGLVSSRELV